MKLVTPLLAAALAVAAAPLAFAKAHIGEAAPAFTLTDSNGKSRSLSEFKGRTVVLEWTNADCPFVKKHYGARNMQAQQKSATGDDVVWLTINSGAAGQQGHVDGAGANAIIKTSGGAQTAYLLDASGEVGRSYGARTTPQMFVIDGDGSATVRSASDLKWQFTAIADHPPTIALVDDPQATPNGLQMSYKLEDDYGVVGAQVAGVR